jgi:hypothetical protein
MALALVFLLAIPHSAFAYLTLGVTIGNSRIPLRWATMPVRYFVSVRSTVPGVSVADFESTMARAFNTWQEVPTSAIRYNYGGLTVGRPGEDDGSSTLGFESHPEQDRVLAATSFLVDRVTGALVESDIFFNTTFQWSVAPGGETGRYDLESIALHEIGHFNGLGHSALGETELRDGGGRRVLAAGSVMFPIAFTAGSTVDRALKADDIAAISDLYPDGDLPSKGSLSGRVTLNSTPLFGAHVIAFDPATGELVGGFSIGSQGNFTIAGLSPGPKVVRVEPLDDADIDSFFDLSRRVDVDFRVLVFDRLVVVPRGGDTGSISLQVTRR